MSPRSGPRDIVAAIGAGRELESWWPVDEAYHEAHGTDPRDEVVIGAVLVQQTAWRQVERALANLRAADACALPAVAEMPRDALAELVRPAGFVSRKPVTLRSLAQAVLDEGGCRLLAESVKDDPDPVRQMLLEVRGVGPETADAVLNFALDAPVFVVDAYTRRLMHRVGVTVPGPSGAMDPLSASYDDVSRWWRSGLPRDAAAYRHAHAAIVAHGQDTCRATPRCPDCPLRSGCATGRARLGHPDDSGPPRPPERNR